MNEEDFVALASKTRLSQRNRDAARLVLVENKRQVDVCTELGMKPQVLSSVLAVIDREGKKAQQAKVEEFTGVLHGIATETAFAASRAEAVKTARDQLGEDTLVRNAPVSGVAIGKVLVKTAHHLVQELGRGEVMVHELSKMDRVPQAGKSIELRYTDGFAVMNERSLSRERGGR